MLAVHSLRCGAAEAIEAIAHGDRRTSKVVGRAVEEIKLPAGTTIDAVVRGGDVIIAHHDTVIENDDHVILFLVSARSETCAGGAGRSTRPRRGVLPSQALRGSALKTARVRPKVSGMHRRNQTQHPPDKPDRPADWREQIKADLEAQLAAGATLYGIRSDGAYIARTKDGDRVIRRPSPESA